MYYRNNYFNQNYFAPQQPASTVPLLTWICDKCVDDTGHTYDCNCRDVYWYPDGPYRMISLAYLDSVVNGYNELLDMVNKLIERVDKPIDDIVGLPGKKDFCCHTWIRNEDQSEGLHAYESYRTYEKLAKNTCQGIMLRNFKNKFDHTSGRC